MSWRVKEVDIPAQSGGAEEIDGSYLNSLEKTLGHMVCPISTVTLHNNRGNPITYKIEQLKEWYPDTTLYLRNGKFLPIYIPEGDFDFNPDSASINVNNSTIVRATIYSHRLVFVGADGGAPDESAVMIMIAIDDEVFRDEPSDIVSIDIYDSSQFTA